MSDELGRHPSGDDLAEIELQLRDGSVSLGKRSEIAVKTVAGWCDCEGQGCVLCAVARLITDLAMQHVRDDTELVSLRSQLAALSAERDEVDGARLLNACALRNLQAEIGSAPRYQMTVEDGFAVMGIRADGPYVRLDEIRTPKHGPSPARTADLTPVALTLAGEMGRDKGLEEAARLAESYNDWTKPAINDGGHIAVAIRALKRDAALPAPPTPGGETTGKEQGR